jgi:hypothetical protein
MKKIILAATVLAVLLPLAGCMRRVPLDRRLPIPGVFGNPAPAEAVTEAPAGEPAPAEAAVPAEEPAPVEEAAPVEEEVPAEEPVEEIAEPLVEMDVPEEPAPAEEAVEPEAETVPDMPEETEIGVEIEEEAVEEPEIVPEPAKLELPETESVPEIAPDMPAIPEEPADMPELDEALDALVPELSGLAPVPPPDDRPAAGLAERREALTEAAAADSPAENDGDIDSLIAAHEAAISEADALAEALAGTEEDIPLPELP